MVHSDKEIPGQPTHKGEIVLIIGGETLFMRSFT